MWLKIVHVLFQYVCQVWVSGEGSATDVDPSIMDARLVNEIMKTLQDVMETQHRKHDQEMTSLHNTMVTQQRHHEHELTSLRDAMVTQHDQLQDAIWTQQRHYYEMTSLEQELIEVMMTKQQHEEDMTSLKYELTMKQGNGNEGCVLIYYICDDDVLQVYTYNWGTCEIVSIIVYDTMHK